MYDSKNETPERPSPQTRKTSTAKPRRQPAIIPYIKGMSEELRRAFNQYEIPAYFKLYNTIRQLLVRPKDNVLKERVVGPVYNIECKDCNATYIGETERSLQARHLATRATRVKEHRQGHSAINSHLDESSTCRDSYSCDLFSIIDSGSNDFDITIKEAMHIKSFKP